MTGRRVVVGTGWWCDGRLSDWLIGDSFTKSAPFFRLWHRLVMQALNPAVIFVTGSCSPVKPDLSSLDRITWTELNANYGHAMDIRLGRVVTKYAGSTRSLFLGAAYALCSDADYYVYLELDCVIRGPDFLEAALAGTHDSILVGDRTVNGRGLNADGSAEPMYQQSLVIVAHSGLRRFMEGLTRGPETDGELSPEIKMERDCAPFGLLAVPYGRSRPIDFTRSHYYAQHLTREELQEFARREAIDLRTYLEP
jgi:hypothetical protein